MLALHAPPGIQPQGAMPADLDLNQVGQAGHVTVEKEKATIEAHLSDCPKLPAEQVRDNQRALPGEGVIDTTMASAPSPSARASLIFL